MIKSFRSKAAQDLFEGEQGDPAWRQVQRVVRRKLLMLDAAQSLDDLRSPPGNRLEALKGDRAGQHSIRINDRYRLCFIWTEDGAEDVEIVDYH
jgi:proteic killer suppression protein